MGEALQPADLPEEQKIDTGADTEVDEAVAGERAPGAINEEPNTFELAEGSYIEAQAKFQYPGFVGNSAVFRRCLDRARAFAPFDGPVLLHGETGVGKRDIVKAIHSGSGKEGPLIHFDCSNTPASLLASRLFGHRKGAYTGAVADGKGLIMAAAEGTFFLDEVENLPDEVQQMLLMVFDSKNGKMRFRSLGSANHHDANVRLVCATNVDLKKLVDQKKFREDLFYRISTFQLDVPSLRERGQAYIAGLIHHLEEEIWRENFKHKGFKKPFQIEPDLLVLLAQYEWPGNVRELNNMLYAAMANAGGIRRDTTVRLADLPNGHPKKLLVKDGKDGGEKIILTHADMVREAERKYFDLILRVTRGDVTLAAEIAERCVRTMFRKIEELKINVEKIRRETRGEVEGVM